MGTPEIAVKSLEAMIAENIIPVAIVTTPDKPKGRGQKLEFSAVKKKAIELNIPILQPDKLKDENFISEVKNLTPDLIVVVAFRVLPKEILSIPKLGAINLHASLLPKYRGAAPINWAIINGEKKSGVTTFFLNEKIDSGKIIFQKECEISSEMNAGDLHDNLSVIGSELLIKTINSILNGNVVELIQNETFVTPAPKIFKQNCKINFNQSSEIIHNFIRGLSPNPTAWCNFKNKSVKIYQTKMSNQNYSEINPGKIIEIKNQLFVSTNNGFLEILKLQVEGGKIISANEFLRGYKIENEFFN